MQIIRIQDANSSKFDKLKKSNVVGSGIWKFMKNSFLAVKDFVWPTYGLFFSFF